MALISANLILAIKEDVQLLLLFRRMSILYKGEGAAEAEVHCCLNNIHLVKKTMMDHLLELELLALDQNLSALQV